MEPCRRSCFTGQHGVAMPFVMDAWSGGSCTTARAARHSPARRDACTDQLIPVVMPDIHYLHRTQAMRVGYAPRKTSDTAWMHATLQLKDHCRQHAAQFTR